MRPAKINHVTVQISCTGVLLQEAAAQHKSWVFIRINIRIIYVYITCLQRFIGPATSYRELHEHLAEKEIMSRV